MRSFEKLAGASLFEASNFEMKAKNQDTSVRKEQKTLDNLIRQTIGKDSLLSFPRSGENPAQLIHLLHAFEQQSGNKFSKGSTVEHGMDSKDFTQEQNGVATPFSTETSTIKESLHSNPKESRSFGNSQQNPMEHMSSLKFPEAVVAIAQAAAKVNGEPEKYLPGWPLLSKVQMLKCEKCSREFVSPLNHRRHIRVHRRLLNLEKGDSRKKRADLAEFWDRLSVDDARQILSLKNVMLEEVSGSSIIKDMTSFIRKPGRLLPQFYVKAGAALLDVAQMKSSRFPLSAADLFSILDDASEKTFLSPGTALSVQKFVFAGEAGNAILEVRNLVASMGFLVEQKLVKAWLLDKDVEALRCQKLLVEEEEAAEKRRAEQLERKRLKKLRQKELKEKEQVINVEIVYIPTSSPEVEAGGSLTAISSSSSTLSEDASPRQIPAASCADYYNDTTVARENDLMSNADHIGPPDMNLESRVSLDSATGVPVDPELDYANQQGKWQDKACTNVNFVRSGRERKSSMETDLVLSQKYVSGCKNQQTFLKRTKKSSNASSSWQVSSSNGVLISDSVSGQRFGSSNKSLAQRNSLGGNVYRIWTKKVHQMPMENINIASKTEDRPKDGADAACEVKLGDSLKSSSDFSDSGLTCESTLMTVQEDSGIMAVETSTISDVNDAQITPILNDDSVTSHCTNPEVTGGELLIGSMSLCLDSFPNGVSKPRQVYKKGILSEECECSADGKGYNSICNCFDSYTECTSASSTARPLQLRVINSSTAKSHRACADSPSGRDCLGHPPKQTGQGMFGKQELRQDGISKPGTKIWRPISNATDCRGEEGITDSIMNSVQIEDLMIDSQGSAAINASAHFPLKHENSRHLICTQNGDSCFADSESEPKIDAHQNEKQFGETVDRTLRNENKLQLLDTTKEGNECFSRNQNEIVETVDQRETNFGSACDAAAAFLSRRWEVAVMSSEAEVLECLDSSAVEGNFSVSSVGSESGRLISGTDSETNYVSGASFQSKDGSDSSNAFQGRQKSFDCGFGVFTGGSSSSHYSQVAEILEIESKGDFIKPSALKPEIEHLKYMPRQRN
ncbi:uncharacterized protein LOC131030525 isoform X1 [Cryptomeria japonica]|uniref:uncharacterized protein LOC131030525 isoform X1 n=1 Tax=Cryptomeria japonica TaxID=3369 RepID=UPI0027DA72AD|nr:uncharacterized protein LOC131030525 isoform X1 [Cryptomeria japonica]XP_057817367.2 uncharacterized protein LOC131030525 isoform X1 [Cryptomeria japonica]